MAAMPIRQRYLIGQDQAAGIAFFPRMSPLNFSVLQSFVSRGHTFRLISPLSTFANGPGFGFAGSRRVPK